MPARGIQRVRLNLKRAFSDIDQKNTNRAVYAILSQGAALAQTMTPIATGFLTNSQYIPRIEQIKGKTVGNVGYTALYAAAVHEKLGTMKGEPRPNNMGRYWDPNAEPRFLTKGFEQLRPSIPAILRSIYGV